MSLSQQTIIYAFCMYNAINPILCAKSSHKIVLDNEGHKNKKTDFLPQFHNAKYGYLIFIMR
jgi:hypothetical protein